MTEQERNQIVQEITQNVLTALANNSIDWSTSKISFSDIESITTATREKVLVPAIDTRNNQRVYGNLDLNTLLSAYGLKEAMKVVDTVEEAGSVVSGEIANAKNEAIAEIDSRTETEKAELSTHANAEKGTISSATSNAISAIQQARDSAKSEVSSTATSKKNELNAIVATGISKIEQTTTSTESGGSNVITITQTNGTPTQFIVRNGSKGEKGDKGDSGSVGDISSYLADYLPLSGGTMTGSVTLEGATLNKPLIVKGGDSASAGKIIFGENGQITNEATATLVGRIGASFYLGHSTYPIYLRGTNIRPYYNTANNTLALSSDIPTSASQVGAVPTSRTINGKALTGNITLSASDVGAGKITYLNQNTTVPAMSVGELKLVGYSSSGLNTSNFKLPSGGQYYIVGINEWDDENGNSWAYGTIGLKSGGSTFPMNGYNLWALILRIS